jgi:hypothetical protein
MPSVREVILSLYGAWRLARLDRTALTMFDTSPAGARRSFFAAALVAPLYALMLAAGHEDGGTPDALRFALVETIAYVLSWVLYPVTVEWLSRALGCRQRFESYLVAYNWSLVVQNAAILPIGILTRLDALPAPAAQVLWLITFAFILAYLFFIARLALAVSSTTATGLVMLDVLLSASIDAVAAGIS